MVVLHDGAGGGRSTEGWWPGLDVPDGKPEMDPDKVRALADELQGLLDQLTDSSKGTLNDLIEKSSVVTMNNSFGGWETGLDLRDSFLEVCNNVQDCHVQLQQQLAMAIQTLRLEADDFEGVDTNAANRLAQYEPTPSYGPPGTAPTGTAPPVTNTPGMTT